MNRINFILVISALYIIPTESRHIYPWTDCAVNFQGSIGCGDTVKGFVSVDEPENSNWYQSYILSVIGSDECEITFSFCDNFTDYEATLSVHDFETYGRLRWVNNFEEGCPNDVDAAIIYDVPFNDTMCTPYYLRVGASGSSSQGNYSLSVNCSAGCTPCTLEEAGVGEAEEEEEEDDDDSSSESVDDAKADFAEYDGEIFRYTDDEDQMDGYDGVRDSDREKEVTLRFGEKVWESIYGVMIVLMVCCGVFCYLFNRVNKQ